MSYIGNTKIGKMFLGDTEIAKAYLGTDLVFQNGGGPIPPVTTIPYIRGGADGSYIDTGITPDETVRVIVWARNVNSSGTDNSMIFGSRDSDFSNSVQLFTGAGASSGRLTARFGGSTAFSTDVSFENLGNYHKYELNADGIYVDDVLVAASGGVSALSNDYTITIFASNNAGTIGYGTICPLDICACQIYKGGSLVRDFKAVNSPSIGLRDFVSNTLFTNAGSGAFVYGTFNTNAYDPLQYVRCGGGSYFDTGIKGGSSLPWVVEVVPQNASATFNYPIGACTGGSTKRYEIGIGNATYVNGFLYFNYYGASNNMAGSNQQNQFTNKEIVFVKSSNKGSAYIEGVQTGSTKTGATNTFTTDYNIYVGARNSSGTAQGALIGRIRYAGFGNLRNFVPALVGGVGGMYDTYNDTFYPSLNTSFRPGPFIKPKTVEEDNMTLIRHWDSTDELYVSGSSYFWYDKIGNQCYVMYSSTQEDGYYEFLNSDPQAADSSGKLVDSLPDLGYHWKCVADVAVKWKSDTPTVALDFGAYGNSGTGTCAFLILLNTEMKWGINAKFNGNDSGPTYNIDNTSIQESGLSDGDWVRRKITVGVRSSSTTGMDETYVIVEGLGNAVSSPFIPIRFNRWRGDDTCYIARGITLSSTYPTATSTRIYSIKFYYEPVQ